jgi:hypothetical protein
MRLASPIDSIGAAALAARCPAPALNALQRAVRALAARAQSAMVEDCANAGREGDGDAAARSDTPAHGLSRSIWLARDPLSARADAFVNDFSLDDRAELRQCRSTVSRVIVPVTPQSMRARNARVTLWDEIAPPSPLPMPVQAARR